MHPSMIEVVFDVLLENDNLMSLIATFVTKNFEKEANRVKKEQNTARSKKKICKLSAFPSTSNPSNDDEILA